MSLPILVRKDGCGFNQAQTIMRYGAKKYGYYPTDAKECYEVDKLCEDYYDIIDKFFAPIFCAPGADQDAAAAKAIECLGKLCKDLEPRMNKGQFLMGSKLMIIDFWVGGLYCNIMTNSKCYCQDQWAAFLKAHPIFDAYGKRFAEANKEYLSMRPDSSM